MRTFKSFLALGMAVMTLVEAQEFGSKSNVKTTLITGKTLSVSQSLVVPASAASLISLRLSDRLLQILEFCRETLTRNLSCYETTQLTRFTVRGKAPQTQTISIDEMVIKVSKNTSNIIKQTDHKTENSSPRSKSNPRCPTSCRIRRHLS